MTTQVSQLDFQSAIIIKPALKLQASVIGGYLLSFTSWKQCMDIFSDIATSFFFS